MTGATMFKNYCGCEIRRSLPHIQGTDYLVYLVFCRLHEAAPELLHLLSLLVAEFKSDPLSAECFDLEMIVKPAMALVTKLETRETTEGQGQ